MDLFTPQSDLDLSVNFNTDVADQFPRKDKISAIRRLAKVLHSHQSNCCLKLIFITSLLAFVCPSILNVHYILLSMHS